MHSEATQLPLVDSDLASRWHAILGETSTLSAAINSKGVGIPLNVPQSTDTQVPVWISNLPATEPPTAFNFGGLGNNPRMPRSVNVEDTSPDRHAIVVDTQSCVAFEFMEYSYKDYGHWAGDAERWVLGQLDEMKPSSKNPGVTVAGLPMVGTMVRLEEVRNGSVNHVIGACSQYTQAPAPELGVPGRVWPAMDTDGTKADGIPMGTRLRLRAEALERREFEGDAAVVAEALATYGIIITDTCSHPLHFTGENALGWNEQQLSELHQILLSEFDFVDDSGLMKDPDTWEVR